MKESPRLNARTPPFKLASSILGMSEGARATKLFAPRGESIKPKQPDTKERVLCE